LDFGCWGVGFDCFAGRLVGMGQLFHVEQFGNGRNDAGLLGFLTVRSTVGTANFTVEGGLFYGGIFGMAVTGRGHFAEFKVAKCWGENSRFGKACGVRKISGYRISAHATISFARPCAYHLLYA